jgi:hypothetical protein
MDPAGIVVCHIGVIRAFFPARPATLGVGAFSDCPEEFAVLLGFLLMLLIIAIKTNIAINPKQPIPAFEGFALRVRPTGWPQLGHDAVSVDISFPQAGHFTRGIV